MPLLRPLLGPHADFRYKPFSPSNKWGKSLTKFFVNGISVADYFARSSYIPVLFDAGEDTEILPINTLLDTSFMEILNRLGFEEFMPDETESKALIYESENCDLGYSICYQNMGFARHLILEVVSDSHAVRIDIKDCWNGGPYLVQIDQVTLSDIRSSYDVPTGSEEFLYIIEEIIGTVDLTIQALNNEDDREGYSAFDDIKRIKDEYLLHFNESGPTFSKFGKPTKR